jgi:TPP-dependent pyruvate/acetoin dehydrogenase alpha subunit
VEPSICIQGDKLTMAAKENGVPGENPLVPNAKLKAMYVAMLEARTLEDAVQKRVRSKGQRRRAASIRNQEAVRASTVFQLEADDLISDTEASAGMASILGADGTTLLRDYTSSKSAKVAVDKLLPSVQETEERLSMALGAALALKAQSRKGVVISYIQKDALRAAAWTRILRPAAKYELPIIFILLPRTAGFKKGDEAAGTTKLAGKAGVPGIPVDACDAVALYRVIQESLGRTRGGDGPVLIECVSWRSQTLGTQDASKDPIEHLRLFLEGRGISTPAWFRQVEAAAHRRLKRKRSAS